jgi:rubrerythrin
MTELRRDAATMAVGRVEIRCAGCGYGGVVAQLPDRCPMCGGAAWCELSSRFGRSDQMIATL